MYVLDGSTLDSRQAADVLLGAVVRGESSDGLMRLAEEMRDDETGFFLGMPCFVYAQAYVVSQGSLLDVPDHEYDVSAREITAAGEHCLRPEPLRDSAGIVRPFQRDRAIDIDGTQEPLRLRHELPQELEQVRGAQEARHRQLGLSLHWQRACRRNLRGPGGDRLRSTQVANRR